jgi:hypothetical protein
MSQPFSRVVPVVLTVGGSNCLITGFSAVALHE